MSESKIDTDEAALASMLSLVLSLANKLSDSDVFVKHGLTVPEWTLLNELPADGSEVTLKKLAMLLGLSPQRVKVLIAKLESRAIVRSSTPPEARAPLRYAITPVGLSLKSAAERVFSDMQTATLTPSQTRGLARAARIVRRLSKAASQTQPAS